MKFLLRQNVSGSSFSSGSKARLLSGLLLRGNDTGEKQTRTARGVYVSARIDRQRTRLSTYPKGAVPGHLVISPAAASALEPRISTRRPLSSQRKTPSDNATMVDPVALGLTEEDVELIVKRYLQEKRDKYNAKFRVLSYHVKRLSEEPIGYLGDHYFLNVVLREKMVHYSAEEEEYAEEEYLSFFLKILPEQVPKLADYVREMGCFKKEIQLYTHLIPRLQDVTIGTKPFAPRAYLTKDEKLLVFENLKAEGYKMLENNKSLLDFAHLEVALKTVAKLHAASLVLEERTKQPIMKLYSGHLNENVYIDDEKYVRKTNLDNAIKALCELIKRIDKYRNSDKLDFILERFPEEIRKIYDFARPSTEYRNVFNHGDLWNNNLMFKYEEQEKIIPCNESVPVDAVLVDYQFSRLAPPAYDVMSLIMISTLSTFRNKHLEAWINIYYDELGSLLAEIDSIDVEDVLPKAVFLESCREYHLAGLIESCMYFHWPPTPDCYEIVNGADWFDESRKPAVFVQASLNGFERNEDYRHRISDMIMQIVDRYVLG